MSEPSFLTVDQFERLHENLINCTRQGSNLQPYDPKSRFGVP
jgi:hypothetical protein